MEIKENLRSYVNRLKAAQYALPPEHQGRLDGPKDYLCEQIQAAIGEAFKASLDDRIKYPDLKTILDEYFRRYDVVDEKVRKLVIEFTEAFFALELILKGTDVQTMAKAEEIEIPNEEIAGVKFSPILTVEDFAVVEQTLDLLRTMQGQPSEDFSLLRQLYASIIDLSRRKEEEGFRIDLPTERTTPALLRCKSLYVDAKRRLAQASETEPAQSSESDPSRLTVETPLTSEAPRNIILEADFAVWEKRMGEVLGLPEGEQKTKKIAQLRELLVKYSGRVENRSPAVVDRRRFNRALSSICSISDLRISRIVNRAA